MKTLAVLVLITVCGFGQQKKPEDNMKKILTGIAELKYDQTLLDVVTTFPDGKECRAKGWPNTEDCRSIALGVVRMIQERYKHTSATGGK